MLCRNTYRIQDVTIREHVEMFWHKTSHSCLVIKGPQTDASIQLAALFAGFEKLFAPLESNFLLHPSSYYIVLRVY